LNPFPGKL
jgi:glycosylphosphatidylinositol transamidase (GPIT) subunit GPI8